MTITTFRLATRPYSLIDAINRYAAATGSCRTARLTERGDFNGHHVVVRWNGYTGRWIADYTWAGPHTIARGSLAECLTAAKRMYDEGARGASAAVSYPEVVYESDRTQPCSVEEFEATCRAAGWLTEDDATAADAAWKDARYGEVRGAFVTERQLGVPATGFLANSATLDEYKSKCDAFLAEQRAEREQARAAAQTATVTS